MIKSGQDGRTILSSLVGLISLANNTPNVKTLGYFQDAGVVGSALPHYFCRVFCAMPELAEVEWYRKQWNAGLGQVIVDLALHAQKRIFRGTDTDALRQHLIGQQFLRSTRRGKRMLFEFSGDNPEIIGARESIRSWLGLHLGMTGNMRVETASFR